MNANKSTVTLHVVSSLDGFIAKNDNSVSRLDLETSGSWAGLCCARVFSGSANQIGNHADLIG
jgi:hypothetical protein